MPMYRRVWSVDFCDHTLSTDAYAHEMQNKSMAANPVNVIALAPPLIILKDEIDEGVAIMDIALEAADAHTE